jgi:hypothetical protein
VYWKNTYWKLCGKTQVVTEGRSFTGNLKSKKRKIFLLGSSHGRGIGPKVQENLGSNFEVCSIFNPFAKVVEHLWKLGKSLTKQGLGLSLDRHYHYALEKDYNFTADRTTKTNVSFVSLLKRHDKSWMDGWKSQESVSSA